MALESEKHEFIVKNLIQYNSGTFSCRQFYAEGTRWRKKKCFFMGVKYHLSKVRLQAVMFIIVLTKASSEKVEVDCFSCTIGSSEC